MIKFSREEVKNLITEPTIKFAVYGDGKLLYVGHSKSPMAYISDKTTKGYWNLLSKYENVRFVIELPDDFDKKPLYRSLHDDNLPRICSYISPALWEYARSVRPIK